MLNAIVSREKENVKKKNLKTYTDEALFLSTLPISILTSLTRVLGPHTPTAIPPPFENFSIHKDPILSSITVPKIRLISGQKRVTIPGIGENVNVSGPVTKSNNGVSLSCNIHSFELTK